jgi:hypothetical protein
MKRESETGKSRRREPAGAAASLLIALCREKLRFLEEEHGFRLAARSADYHAAEVTYQNQTTGVSVYYEYRDGAVWAVLRRLVQGRLPGYEDRVNAHGLWTLQALRDPAYDATPKMGSGPLTDAQMQTEITAIAEALRKFAPDILAGEFSVFPELARIERQSMEREDV